MFNFKNINLLLAFTRFPLASLFAIVGSFTFMYAIDATDTPNQLINIIIICALGVFSNVAITVAAESNQWSTKKQLTSKVVLAVCLLLFFFLFLPDSYDSHKTKLFKLPFQIASIILFLHLLISYIPFLSKGSEEDFWEYNKDVFLRFVESFFYACFLFVGLAVALLALDKLFGIDLDGVAYPRLFIFLVGIFHTIYFLSKYPTVFYDNKIKRPIKAYLIFSQYILIPLVLIYLTILYAYALKIGIQWELPQGWVSQLSLWFSVVGIFAYLLNCFNHKFSDFKPTAYFKRYFFPALFLPTLLVFIAIYRRVSEYGITELRYVVALLGLWLLGITLYFNLSKTKKIKVIPISLSIIVLLPILTGPFNMFNTAVASQEKRFKKMLIDNSLLADDKLLPLVKGPMKFDSIYSDNKYKLANAIKYLDERTDLLFVNDWIKDDLAFVTDNDPTMIADSIDRYHNGVILAKELKIDDLFPRYVRPTTGRIYNFYHHQKETIELEKNKFFVPIDAHKVLSPNRSVYFRMNKDKSGLLLFRDDIEVGEISLNDYYSELVGTVTAQENKYVDSQINNPLLVAKDSSYHASLIINNISGRKLENNKIVIESIWGHAIITFK